MIAQPIINLQGQIHFLFEAKPSVSVILSLGVRVKEWLLGTGITFECIDIFFTCSSLAWLIKFYSKLTPNLKFLQISSNLN